MTDITRVASIQDIYLLPYVGYRQQVPSPARDLYISSWFCKARSYAETTGQPWFILSTKHGLLHPGEVILPYDRTLNTMSVDNRRQWARRVLAQLGPRLDGVRSSVFLAGYPYHQFLEPSLRHRGLEVTVPNGGLEDRRAVKMVEQDASRLSALQIQGQSKGTYYKEYGPTQGGPWKRRGRGV